MSITSSGLLLYRHDESSGALELLIGHMGGPFFARKHQHGWSIPKGLAESGDSDLVAVAEREFTEEMGSAPPPGETFELGSAKSSRKTIVIFAREGDFDLSTFHSNEFEMEWPRGSGQMQSFPEIDKADWVDADAARTLLVKSQGVFIDRLLAALSLASVESGHAPDDS